MTLMSNLLPSSSVELSWRNPLVVTLDGVFSPAECAGLIERIERAGPTPAPVSTARGPVMRPDLRTNDRVMFDDPALAGLIFGRLKPHLPSRLEGAWTMVGANERLRCYRYRPGQAFAPHYDGSFHRSEDEVSLLTVLLYLNACEAGGATQFLDLERLVEPAQGRVLVFNHHLLHEGCPVLAGLKYVVRTDLMFQRERPCPQSARGS
ncbi:MAG: 2OG-Fe(II) oxygenase [Myxococcaceae bacterium]|jgi:prolyl 4-hydroxylase|nr:2OG-Fe(II) oxygenase [Myxococcaceae bacterium]MCA3011079.1 2OG-Fe(II) oxygenase [Myxococcaceae bacterium]